MKEQEDQLFQTKGQYFRSKDELELLVQQYDSIGEDSPELKQKAFRQMNAKLRLSESKGQEYKMLIRRSNEKLHQYS